MNNPTNTQLRDRLNRAKDEPVTAGLALELMPLLETVMDKLDRLKKKYNELLLSVSNKFPHETRHETALRYIIERERYASQPQKENRNE